MGGWASLPLGERRGRGGVRVIFQQLFQSSSVLITRFWVYGSFSLHAERKIFNFLFFNLSLLALDIFRYLDNSIILLLYYYRYTTRDI